MNRDVHPKVGGDVMITLPWWTCTIKIFIFPFPVPVQPRYTTFVQS
jgi:hypothetical protein